METIVSTISNFGFPIAMVLWFMFRMEKVLSVVTKTVESNTTAINQLKAAIRKA